MSVSLLFLSSTFVSNAPRSYSLSVIVTHCLLCCRRRPYQTLPPLSFYLFFALHSFYTFSPPPSTLTLLPCYPLANKVDLSALVWQLEFLQHHSSAYKQVSIPISLAALLDPLAFEKKYPHVILVISTYAATLHQLVHYLLANVHLLKLPRFSLLMIPSKTFHWYDKITPNFVCLHRLVVALVLSLLCDYT